MSDPLRTDPIHAPEPHANPERDAKIESLLLSGLDHYFSSDYTQAIDVWTRALFLDRHHARARAYIERARSALAEQQRESEELLHSGIDAFERGQIDSARQLLNAAVQRGGAHDVALAFLTRIDRISAATHTIAVPVPIRPGRRAFPAIVPARKSPMLMAVAAVTAVAVMAYALASWREVRAFIPVVNSAASGAIPAAIVRERLAVPTSAGLALDRAHGLFAGGRLHDALRALELVRPTDPLHDEADRLKAAIQREMIAHATAQP